MSESESPEFYNIEKENLNFKDPPTLVWITVQKAVQLLWSENPKLHDVGLLVQSIEKHGFQELPRYDTNLPNVSGGVGAIKAGNGRIETLAAMERDSMQLPRGLAQDKSTQAWVMPILMGTDVDSVNAARAYAIDSNNLTLSGGDFTAFDFSRLWDNKAYIEMLKILGADNNLPISIDDNDLDAIIRNLNINNELIDAEPQIDHAAELQEKWQVKTGDLWRIGEHRLLCGDSTKREDVEKVLNGEAYNILTDPPYNIGFGYNRIDDKMSDADYAEFCRQWFSNVIPEAIGAIFTPGPHNEKYYPEPRDRGFWIKRYATAGASCFYLRLTEPLLFYGKFETRRNTDVFEYSTGFPEEMMAAQRAANVLDKHAPVKSMPLWVELLGMFTDVPILDVFIGNGTTLIACQNLGHKCRAIEISPEYCAVTLERIATAFPGIEIERN
jgi:hypothetical protein